MLSVFLLLWHFHFLPFHLTQEHHFPGSDKTATFVHVHAGQAHAHTADHPAPHGGGHGDAGQSGEDEHLPHPAFDHHPLQLLKCDEVTLLESVPAPEAWERVTIRGGTSRLPFVEIKPPGTAPPRWSEARAPPSSDCLFS